jgi:thiol-activated cytolysin
MLGCCIVLGCSQDPVEVTEGESIDTRQDVNSYVLGLGHLDVAEVMPKTELACPEDECPLASQEGDLGCTYTRFGQTAQFDRFVALQPNSATLWPGSIVRGEDAQAGVLTPIGAPLAPVVFSISLENIAGSPVGTMEEPSLSAFREERNRILATEVTGATPAAIDFDVREVYGESQLSLALGASVSWPGGGEVAASFDFSSQEKKTKILVNFTQSYYTIDVDTPAQPQDFFVPDVTVEDLEPFMSAESPPVYVQSMTYGRRVIFSVETSETAQNIAAALQATYAGAVDVGASVSVEHQEMLADSTIRAFVLGGSGVDATAAINGFEGLVQYIQNGGDYSKDSPGAPIAYKLAYLDNAVTQLAFTTEYTERTCVRNRATLRAELLELTHVGGSDTGGKLELYGNVTLRHPLVDGDVVSCEVGGKVTPIWALEQGSWISLPEMSTWTPTSPVAITLEDVPIGEKQYICLSTQMLESDADELNSDDDFGTDARLISFEAGWPGEHVLQARGDQERGVDVKVRVTVE